MRNRFTLNESEKNRIKKLHGINTINEQNDFDFSIDGIKNIIPYWAEKAGYDADDIDVSIEGISNMPAWWNNKLTNVVKDKVEEEGDSKDSEELIDDMYNTMKTVYDKLPSKNEVINTIKTVFCPWC